MFFHNFKYTMKVLFKNKMLIFWTFAFPIILGTFFNMAFSNIEDSEKLDVIDIAVVNNKEFEENIYFKETFKTLSEDESNKLFNIKYVNSLEADKLLNDGEITGYLLLEDVPKVIIKSNGINETILKYVTEEIAESEEIIKNITTKMFQENPELIINNSQDIYNKIAEMLNKENIYIEDKTNNNLSYTMIEFYTLIAMACLYGGILSMVTINQILPTMSHTGKRVSISKAPKSTLIMSSVVASFITQLIGVFLLFIYTIFALKVDYGNNLFLVIIIAIIGSLAGLSLGIFIATVIKGNENLKTGIILAITMLGCFLSGMMGITMKYIIDKNIPIINKINPASMITDGFYSLYYYDTLNRYYFNIFSLLVFAIILILIAILSLRRQKYDNI